MKTIPTPDQVAAYEAAQDARKAAYDQAQAERDAAHIEIPFDPDLFSTAHDADIAHNSDASGAYKAAILVADYRFARAAAAIFGDRPEDYEPSAFPATVEYRQSKGDWISLPQ